MRSRKVGTEPDYGTNLDCSSDCPRSPPQVMCWRTRPGLVCRVGRDLDVGLQVRTTISMSLPKLDRPRMRRSTE